MEISARDRAVITKHETLGGLVNLASVKEQLLYEIGDPRAYITADCIADFTTIELEQLGRTVWASVASEDVPPRTHSRCPVFTMRDGR